MFTVIAGQARNDANSAELALPQAFINHNLYADALLKKADALLKRADALLKRANALLT
jgi:hypothetical protein